jgi:hypothetical protein
MKQEKVAGKILVELLGEGIVSEEHEEIVYQYLMQAYAAGWLEGTKQRSNKKQVIQLSLEGKPICIYDSTLVAERRTGIANQAISLAATSKTKSNEHRTAGGYRWAYVDHSKPTSSETQTIGTSQSKPKHPK